jgi:hypothetical protein
MARFMRMRAAHRRLGPRHGPPGPLPHLPRASRLRACASVGIIKDTRDNKKYQNHTHPQSVIHATLARNVQDGICQCASVPGNSIGALVSLVNDEVDTASPSVCALTTPAHR